MVYSISRKVRHKVDLILTVRALRIASLEIILWLLSVRDKRTIIIEVGWASSLLRKTLGYSLVLSRWNIWYGLFTMTTHYWEFFFYSNAKVASVELVQTIGYTKSCARTCSIHSVVEVICGLRIPSWADETDGKEECDVDSLLMDFSSQPERLLLEITCPYQWEDSLSASEHRSDDEIFSFESGIENFDHGKMSLQWEIVLYSIWSLIVVLFSNVWRWYRRCWDPRKAKTTKNVRS